MKSVLITGANVGLGKELARQLALAGSEKIYLGCRNLEKARVAKHALETETAKNVFEIIQIDLSDLSSVQAAIASLDHPVEGLVMNAGGPGGQEFLEIGASRATNAFAANVLGHAALAEGLLLEGKLTKAGVFAGTEVIRGVPEMGMKRPHFSDNSRQEFIAVANGSKFTGEKDPTAVYGPIKYVGVLWLAALSRRYPNVRLVSMSPGGTVGTDGLSDLPLLKRWIFAGMMRAMVPFGRMHHMDVGAGRYVDALIDTKLESGKFYASKKGVSGPLIDQGVLMPDLWNPRIQDNAYEAVHHFLSV